MGNCQKDSEGGDLSPRDKLRTGPVEEMEIMCITWNKDYQGLFDYESKEITRFPLVAKQSGILMKVGNQYEVVTQLTKAMVTENSDKFLFKFVKKPDCFHIEPLAIETNNFVYEKNLWMVVKSTPNHEYSLRENDIIKLGRQKIRVKEKIYKERPGDADDRNPSGKEINCQKTVYRNLTKTKTLAVITASNFNQALDANAEEKQVLKQPDNKEEVTIPAQTPKVTEDESEPLCRICLDPGLTTNPLIIPCKCAGSMKYIHLVCLQMWLGKRLNPVSTPYSVTLNWKPLLCELCTTHFLYKIYLDNKKYYTVEIPRPPKPYLVMEVLHKDKNKKKIYSLVSFADKKKLNLGRKHDTDVRISEDISVSRIHSSIRWEEKDKEFIIQDASSKFGTLVLIKKRLVVRDTSSGLAIQVGPNVFQFRVRRGFGQPGQPVPKYEEEEEELEEEEEDDDAVEDEEGEQVEEQQMEEQENARNGEQLNRAPRAPAEQHGTVALHGLSPPRPAASRVEEHKEEQARH